MKKIISLIIVFVLSLCLCSCAHSYRGTLLHPTENAIQIQDYFEKVLGSKSFIISDNFGVAFSFKEEVKDKDYEEQSSSVTRIKGNANYDDGMLIDELKLNGNFKETYVLPTTDKKIKTTNKITEKSVFFFISGGLDRSYVFNKISVKNKVASSYQEQKTMDEENSFSLEIFSKYLSLRSVRANVESFLTKYFSDNANCHIYLNGDDMTLVESYSRSNKVIYIDCSGDDLIKITVEEKISPYSGSTFVSRKYTVAICNEETINKPEDKDMYEEKNQDHDEDF